jgi:hypothetical protein
VNHGVDKIHERQVNLVQAAALFQALGGGWWSRADFPKN